MRPFKGPKREGHIWQGPGGLLIQSPYNDQSEKYEPLLIIKIERNYGMYPIHNSPFSSSRDTTVQNLDFTRQTTDITHFAVVFHYDVISI